MTNEEKMMMQIEDLYKKIQILNASIILQLEIPNHIKSITEKNQQNIDHLTDRVAMLEDQITDLTDELC